MKTKFAIFILFVFITVAKFTPSVAQNSKMRWAIGLDWNAIDDDGKRMPSFRNLMMVPYPSRIHGGRFLGVGVTLDAAVSYNKYVNGTIINGEIAKVSNHNLYFSFDAIIKYNLFDFLVQSHLVKEDNLKKFYWGEPYIIFGYGYTYRDFYAKVKGAPTNNLGIGFNIWLKPFIGLNFQGIAKFRMINGVSNHVQYCFGAIYRFPRTEEGSKRVNMQF
ncbi:MAG: hypothetical protein V1781_02860 [Bacteroidota bacterium]